MNKNIITLLLCVLSVIGTVLAIIINFLEIMMGSEATIKNIVASVIYMVIWILLGFFIIKDESKGAKIYFIIFWSMTFITSFLTFFANVFPDNDFSYLIILVVVFSTPLYGFKAIFTDYVILSIVVTIISVVFIFCICFFQKKTKRLD